MKTSGSAKAFFKLAEETPEATTWGHTGYIWVEQQEPLLIDEDRELFVWFEPKEGTTFEEIEQLSYKMVDLLKTVNFSVGPKGRYGHDS